jgi:hypothetical protein
MFKKEKSQESKYKVLLVAYKDLAENMEKELLYHFISNIRSKEEIEENASGSDKSSSGLSFRTGLYHNWFKEIILEKLKSQYKLGIVEIPKSYGDSGEVRLKELDEKFGDNILIVATEEL